MRLIHFYIDWQHFYIDLDLRELSDVAVVSGFLCCIAYSLFWLSTVFLKKLLTAPLKEQLHTYLSHQKTAFGSNGCMKDHWISNA